VVCGHGVLALEQIGALIGRKLTAEDVELWTWTAVERGFSMPVGQYLAAISLLQVWSRRVAQWWSDGFDLLLTPTIAAPPPPLGTLVASREDPRAGWARLMNLLQFTPAYNATGQPAISLPLYWNAEGLPVGVQLVSAFGREDLLVRIAAQLEQARPWRDRRPPICA
jgi:amidase